MCLGLLFFEIIVAWENYKFLNYIRKVAAWIIILKAPLNIIYFQLLHSLSSYASYFITVVLESFLIVPTSSRFIL